MIRQLRELRRTIEDRLGDHVVHLAAAVDEYVAADTAVAQQYIADLRAGVEDDTPANDAVNDRACDAEEALPFWLRAYADRRSEAVNGDLWETAWDIEDALESKSDGHVC